jgi:hypothetical protein
MSAFGDAMAEGKGMGEIQGTTVPDLPRASIFQAESTGLDPTVQEQRRKLAQIRLAQLNSGKLNIA